MTPLQFRCRDGMLAEIARRRGILLCLDYDGTVSEITPAAASARPVEGIRTSIERIASTSKQACVAIVSGRRIEEVKRLLGIDSGILFSGVHGLEFTDANSEASFVSDVAECAPELARVRQWLLGHVPDSRGFRIEDKVAAVGLHYRQADASEAAELCGRFSEFVCANAPRLKFVQLKMIDEAMPRSASKARAIELLKARKPPPSRRSIAATILPTKMPLPRWATMTLVCLSVHHVRRVRPTGYRILPPSPSSLHNSRRP